jgi:hypothetical protein
MTKIRIIGEEIEGVRLLWSWDRLSVVLEYFCVEELIVVVQNKVICGHMPECHGMHQQKFLDIGVRILRLGQQPH